MNLRLKFSMELAVGEVPISQRMFSLKRENILAFRSIGLSHVTNFSNWLLMTTRQLLQSIVVRMISNYACIRFCKTTNNMTKNRVIISVVLNGVCLIWLVLICDMGG